MPPRELSLGFSPCPNDTFIFHALTHGLVACDDFYVIERLEDVETLNRLALEGLLDLTKVSYHAFGHLRKEYCLLRSGGALGRGCGPLVIAPQATTMAELRGRRIAVPGELTTANLLLQLYGEGFDNLLIVPFDRIMDSVSRGEAAAGVIIHESRFTYRQCGLVAVLDLGVWWETTTGLPLPLGGILAHRRLGTELIHQVETAIRRSVGYAFAHPQAARPYIKQHSQELDDDVIASHIALYVNDFSFDLGTEGCGAVEELLRRAEAQGIIPRSTLPLFAC